MKKVLISTLFLVFLFLGGCSLKNAVTGDGLGNNPGNDGSKNVMPIACTLEAKICSDGSAVGRTGANCEFAPCPIGEVNKKASTFKVYFGNNNFNPNASNCGQVYPLERVEALVSSTPQLALQELFKGPSETEKAQAYYSWFSEKTLGILKSIKIENNIAYVNLKDIRQIIPNASASCGSAEFLAEMQNTLQQFPEIKKVIFAIDEKPATFYEWLQIGCASENNFCDAGPFKP